MVRRIGLIVVCVSVLVVASCGGWPRWRDWQPVPSDPADAGPHEAHYIQVTLTNPETGRDLPTVIWFPADGSEVDASGAPYAALVFAPGFFASPLMYPGNGQQLATWGYVVAMPDFPDERIGGRVSDARYLLSYLGKTNVDPGSTLYGMIDTGRLGMVGHSLGGLTALVAAARDERIKAVVALDPVNPPGFLGVDLWDMEGEAPGINAPTLVIGAPSQTCNYYASYEEIYPVLGAPHKAKLVVSEGNHCDFMVTDNPYPRDACYQLCRGRYAEDRVALGGRYTVAWLNYYLRGDVRFYAYLYGNIAQDDLEAGLLTRDVQTAPKDVTGTWEASGVHISWARYDHPVVAGYNIYRREEGGAYGSQPYARVGPVSSYVDTDVGPKRLYFYILRSRDSAGNEHQPSAEVSAAPGG